MLTADLADAVVGLTRRLVERRPLPGEDAGGVDGVGTVAGARVDLAQLRRYPVAVADAVGRFLAALADGGRIAYAADPTLKTIQVIAS